MQKLLIIMLKKKNHYNRDLKMIICFTNNRIPEVTIHVYKENIMDGVGGKRRESRARPQPAGRV